MDESIDARARDDISLARLLAAVADPVRLRILAAIRRPCPVQEICEAVGGLAQPRVSHHLAVLREHGLVTAERQGRQRLYRWANPDDDARRDLLRLLSGWLGRPVPPAGSDPGLRVPRSPAARAGTTELEDFLL